MSYIIAFLLIVVAGLGFALFRTENTPIDTQNEAPVESVETPDEEAIIVATSTVASQPITIVDGTYSTSTTYFTPKRIEYKMEVSITTTDGIVTDTSIVYSDGAENDPNAKRFDEAYKSEVVGKHVKEISLSRVGGASLTTTAFNEALNKIVAENS